MADHQRIHPTPTPDVEAQTPLPPSPKPTAPLMPLHSSRSDQLGNPAAQQPLPAAAAPARPPLPHNRSKLPKKRRSCCCRCFCWTVSLLFLLVVIIAAAAGILYLVFRPKLPKYSVDGLRVTQLGLGADASLSAAFAVNVTARNPNSKIGIYYKGGSELSVWYGDSRLCAGTFPVFYQGHRNTTVLDVALTGKTENAAALLTSMQEQQQATGRVPLALRARVPVRIKLGKLKLMKMKFRVRCSLMVDKLSADNPITVQTSSCKFRFNL